MNRSVYTHYVLWWTTILEVVTLWSGQCSLFSALWCDSSDTQFSWLTNNENPYGFELILWLRDQRAQNIADLSNLHNFNPFLVILSQSHFLIAKQQNTRHLHSIENKIVLCSQRFNDEVSLLYLFSTNGVCVFPYVNKSEYCFCYVLRYYWHFQRQRIYLVFVCCLPNRPI